MANPVDHKCLGDHPAARRKAVCDLEHTARESPPALRLLVSGLGDPSDSVRARAAWALAGVGVRADYIVAKLLERLRDPGFRVFVRAMQAIGMLARGNQAAVDQVAAFLGHPAPVVRRLAVDTLGDIAEPGSIAMERLTRTLEDEDPMVRASGIQSLQTIYGPRPELIPYARALLQDPDTGVRVDAISLLGAVGPPAEDTVPEIIEAARGCLVCLVMAMTVLPKIAPADARSADALTRIHRAMTARLPLHRLPPPRPGEVRLVLFDGQHQQVVSSWPALQAWKKTTVRAPWRTCDPDLDLQRLYCLAEETEPGQEPRLPLAHGRRTEVYAAFLLAIPRRVREWVLAYPEGYWRLLHAFRRLGSAAEDLAAGGAFALLFMLAHLDRFDHAHPRQDWSCARSLVRRRQRDALHVLGFQRRESVARLLRNVPPGTCTVANLRLLRKILRNQATHRLLAHLPRINAGVLLCLARHDRREFCTGGLLAEIGKDRSNDTIGLSAGKLGEVLRMADRLGCAHELTPLRSLARLEALHRDLNESLCLAKYDGVDFPPPPLPGVPGQIEPIRTPEELFLEGRTMKHCVGEYAPAIAAGNAYAYRVAAGGPEGTDRATLVVVNENTRSEWMIDGLRGMCNKRVSPATESAVRRFMAGGGFPCEIPGPLRDAGLDQPGLPVAT